MSRKWQIKKEVNEDFIQKFPEMNPVTLQLLYSRGIDTQEKIDEFFYPDYSKDVHDPFLFSDMQKVIARMKTAIAKKEKVVLHGDYDADGVCSTVVLAKTLRAYGVDPIVYIPHRDKEGYGLNFNTIENLKKQGAKVILTVDCGITNIEEVELANKYGIDVIITDHHELEEKLPEAHAIIHARLKDGKYPFGYLAGVGIAFKVAQAFLRSDLEPSEPIDRGSFEKWLLDLVAIGTIADVVPLVGENRTLAKYGLVVLNKTRNIGLKNLVKNCRFRNGLIDSTGIAFRIAPRINAAGRMDHASVAYELLMTSSEDEAIALASKLEGNNQKRQQDMEKMRKQSEGLLIDVNEKDKIVFVYKEDWPKSLVGLLAGRLSDKYSKPVIAMGGLDGCIYGSGRSVEGFNMAEALQELDRLFSTSGGHAMAMGFSLKEKGLLDEFKQEMSRLAEKNLKGQTFSRTTNVDVAVELKDIDWAFFEDLEKLDPFGEANPKPLFLCNGLEIINKERVGFDGKHVKFVVDHKGEITRKVIAFGMAEACNDIDVGDKIDMVFEVDVNEWNGNRELQLKMVDFKKS